MKIKIVSDLHLEFADINIQNTTGVDVLILSGDILVIEKLLKPEAGKPFRDFLSRVTFQFPHVIYVAGNHEFYSSGKFFQGIEDLRAICSQYPNLHFLERDTVTIDDVLFVGGTLWTDCNKYDPLTMMHLEGAMNDYRATRNDKNGFMPIRASDTCNRFRLTRDYIMTVLDQNKDKKCVVVTHHTPSFQSCHPQYAHDTLMNGGYHSELSEYILDRPQIKLWTHGHTHNAFDYTIGETRVVCNPRGYESYNWTEQTGWDPEKVVEI
jgi:predicted phosphodiesterase